ncbi:MAG: hypothetical protein PUB05_03800 [Firmicutes bacterium]|nr:hypothetical protein [Bacillota bacterium]
MNAIIKLTAHKLGAKHDAITIGGVSYYTLTFGAANGKPDFAVVCIDTADNCGDSAHFKAAVKDMLGSIRTANPLASIVVADCTASGKVVSAAVTEYGGDGAKVYYVSLGGVSDKQATDKLTDFIASRLTDTISDIAKLVLQTQNPDPNESACWLSTDYWKAVPMVNQEMLDNGYTGGEGCQWPSWIEYDPVDGNYAYMGTDVGGVYRSTDGGVNWEPSTLGLNTDGGVCISADPKNSARVILIGSNDISTGVFLSTDHGETWNRQYATRLSRAHDWRAQIAFDVTSEPLTGGGCSVVYWMRNLEKQEYIDRVGADKVGKIGLFKSTDGGETWGYVEGTEPYASGWLQIDVYGSLYVAVGGKIYKSTDGGSEWTVIFDQTDSGVIVNSLCIIRTKGYENNVYAMTNKGLFLSCDSGSNFTKITADADMPAPSPRGYTFFTYLAVSPVNPKLMSMQNDALTASWIAANGTADYSTSFYFSTDGGKTWTESYMDKTTNVWAPWGVRQRILSYHPTEENIILTLGGDSIYRSTDGGKTYTMSSQGYTGILVGNKCSFNLNDPNLIAVSSQDYNGGYSVDGGKTWKYINFSGLNWGGFTYGAYALNDKTVVAGLSSEWATDSKAKQIIVATFDGGETIERYAHVGGYGITGDLIATGAKGDSDIAFMGEWRTTDGAKSWQRMDGCTGVYTCDPVTGWLFGVNAHPDEVDGNTVIYKDIVMSKDDGATWSVLCDSTKCSRISDIAYNSQNGTVYFNEWSWELCSFKLDEKREKMTDDGIKVLMHRWNCGVSVDTVNPDIVYTVCYTNQEHDMQNVYRSIDGGEHWTGLCRMKGDGRKGVDGANYARGCIVNPVTHELLVHTQHAGLWRISGLPSVMYDGGLNSANLKKYVTIYDALPQDCRDKVSDDIAIIKSAVAEH